MTDAQTHRPEHAPGHEHEHEHERFENVLDHIREGFQIIGFDWRYRYVNASVCRHGRRAREELIGRTMMEVYPGIETTEVFGKLERVMRERVSIETENEFVFPDDSRAWFELRIEPVPDGILILSLDIDERKSLERQFRQAQKMEAVGRLAGGIAHDFNNILTAIQSFAGFALETIDANEPAHADVAGVLEAAERAETLVGQLLAFSRKQRIEPKVLNLNDVVASLDPMLRRIIGEDVVLVTRPQGELWSVLVDPGAFEQVLVNLAVNARDAMPNGGTLTVETGNAILDESYAAAKGDLIPPGDYVSVSVSDEGAGIDPEALGHLFEPFFTTKELGRGTGLGLSTCYGIVRQAGGYIWVRSEPGRGATFKIYLPRAEAAPAAKLLRRKASPSPSPRGDETVLVVEDDVQVRKLAVRCLERFGYHVLDAEDGLVAERLCEEHGETIDLLLADVIMPGSSGPALAEKLARRRPELRVLFMSGYTEDSLMSGGGVLRDAQLIEKPFTPHDLARKVREALDAHERRS